MSERSGFFPYVEGDVNSEYDHTFLSAFTASIISNGVYNGELAVSADGSGMTVMLPAGRAWINGYYYRNDGPLTLPVDNADGVLHRKDTVVLRWDVNARSITAQVLKGAPASNPVAPQIVRDAEQYDLKLAEISIPAGTTAITQSLITDTRLDNSVCGIVHGVVQQVDTATLYAQIQDDLARFKSGSEADFATWRSGQQTDFAGWSADQREAFDTWFDGVKGILGEDEAGQLLDLINGKSSKSTVTTATLPASGWTGSDAPYSQTISVAAVTATSANELLPGASITADQLDALQSANIQDGGQAAGHITLLAYGDKPGIDLPVRVIVRGDL